MPTDIFLHDAYIYEKGQISVCQNDMLWRINPSGVIYHVEWQIVTSVSEYNNASVFTVSSPWTATHSSETSVNYLPLNIAEHPRRFKSLKT